MDNMREHTGRKIRVANSADLYSIRNLANEIWKVSYVNIISDQQILYMLETMYSISSLLRQTVKEGCTFYILSEGENDLGFASVSQHPEGVCRLNKLYVDTTRHGSGLGKDLLQKVEDHVKNVGCSILELNVNKRNPAVSFYIAKGFIVHREEVLDIGNGFVMDDYVMRKSL